MYIYIGRERERCIYMYTYIYIYIYIIHIHIYLYMYICTRTVFASGSALLQVDPREVGQPRRGLACWPDVCRLLPLEYTKYHKGCARARSRTAPRQARRCSRGLAGTPCVLVYSMLRRDSSDGGVLSSRAFRTGRRQSAREARAGKSGAAGRPRGRQLYIIL